MEFKKYVNTYIIGFIGSLIIILSEFFSWFSNYNLLEIYIFTSSVELADSFLYLFPIMSGIICLIASSLVIYKIELKVKSVIVSFVGLGFLVIFFVDYISQEFEFLLNAGIGFYLGVVGFLLVLINIINSLLSIEKQREGN